MKKILICLVLIFSCALFDCYLEKKNTMFTGNNY